MSPHRGDTVDPDLGKPLRIALISDVHANLPAFRAVLDDVAETGVDETWCLGDLVGYGAQPDECTALAREACDVCLVGNHDLVVLGKLDISTFSLNAALAARWTQEQISAEAVDFMGELEPSNNDREIGLFHASPRDPVWEYVLSTLQADACIDAMDARVGAIGHSHVALFFTRSGSGELRGEQVDNGSCTGASAKVAALASQVRQLPSSVDSEVKRNLQAGVARLGRLVQSCQRQTPTNTTPTTTVPTTTVPTTTVPTTTVP